MTDTAEVAPRRRRWSRYVMPAFGVGLSIVLIVGVLRSAPLDEVWEALTHVNPFWFSLAMLCIVGNLALRGGRWSLLFGPDHTVPWRPAAGLAMIGIAINAVLPGRVGELARLGLAMRRFRAGFVVTASSMMIERILDGVTLLGFLGVSLLILPDLDQVATVDYMGFTVDGGVVANVAEKLAIVCLLAFIGGASLAASGVRRVFERLIERAPFPGEGLRKKLLAALASLGRLFTSLGQPKRLAAVAAYSVVTWMFMALGNYVVMIGMPEIELSFLQILVITSITMAVTSIPSAPGAWGVFEAGGLLALGMMSIDVRQADAVAFLFALHISHYIPVIACGALSGVAGHVSWRSIREAAKGPSTP